MHIVNKQYKEAVDYISLLLTKDRQKIENNIFKVVYQRIMKNNKKKDSLKDFDGNIFLETIGKINYFEIANSGKRIYKKDIDEILYHELNKKRRKRK